MFNRTIQPHISENIYYALRALYAPDMSYSLAVEGPYKVLQHFIILLTRSYTKKYVAILLGVSRSMIYRILKTKEIPSSDNKDYTLMLMVYALFTTENYHDFARECAKMEIQLIGRS